LSSAKPNFASGAGCAHATGKIGMHSGVMSAGDSRQVKLTRVRRAVFCWGGLRPPQQKTLFEGCGAMRHSPQMGIIELTLN